MPEAVTRTRANALITVHKYEPAAYDELAEGPALSRIHVEESFSGDIARRRRRRVLAGCPR